MTFAQSQDLQPTVSLKLTPQQPFKPLRSPQDQDGAVQTQEEEPGLLLEPGQMRWIEVRLSHRWRTNLTLRLKLVDPHGVLRESSCFKGWRTEDNLYDELDDESSASGEGETPEDNSDNPSSPSGERESFYELEFPGVEVGKPQSHYLVFAIPEDFFTALGQRAFDSAPLRLNYPLALEVWVIRESSENAAREDDQNGQLAQLVRFNVALRPECLYLNFLPSLYQGHDFLRRFLAILEASFHPSWEVHQTLWAYLDPKLAPKALLPFLAHWVGWKLDPRLDERRNRILISKAVQLYRWRGTKRGLQLCLRIYTDLPPEAIEIEQPKREGFILGETKFGDEQAEFGAAAIRPYYFEVILRPDADHELDESLVRDVIDEYKPAFCQYKLMIEPRPAATSLPADEDSRLS